MTRRRAVVMLGLVAVLATPVGAVRAQATGGMPVRAFVVGTPLAIAGLRDLAFGTIPSGAPATVAPGAPNAGAFVVTGEKNARVLISFVLPSVLTHETLGPGTTLPITFGPGSALWRRRTNDPSGATAFDPATGATGMLGPPVEPLLYVWIGGTVSPPLTQPGGTYRATVIATVAYTN